MVLPERTVSLGELLRDMAADPRIVDEMVQAARDGSPEIARLPRAENRRHVAALLTAGLSSFELLADPSERDFAEARRLGAARAAQGISVTALLQGVQAGRRVVVEAALRRGRAAGIPDTALLEGLLDLDRYAGALERALVDGYHAAERELSRTEQDARNRVLRRLLADGSADREDLLRFGLRPDGRYHCVVTDVTDPARIRTAERSLTRCGALFGTVDDRLTGLAPGRLPAGALEPGTLAITAPARPLDRLPTLHPLCVAALRVAAATGLRGERDLVDLAGRPRWRPNRRWPIF
ncbi:helix-turn-helix domain-containing protein [Micromonospora zhanjiangensis]